MRVAIIIFIILFLSSFSFALNLSLENMQGGSEERSTFRKIDEREFLSFTVVKSDPTNLEPIRIWNAPTGSKFSGSIFSWTPDRHQAGMYEISFSVLDQIIEQFVFSTIKIVVDNTCFDIQCNKTFEYLFTATDPDNDKVELTIINLPQGATFTGGQFTPKLFKWRPTRQQQGNHQMSIIATDFPESDFPKQDISIVYIKVTRSSKSKFNYYIDDKINMDDFILFAVNWLKGDGSITDPIVELVVDPISLKTIICAAELKNLKRK